MEVNRSSHCIIRIAFSELLIQKLKKDVEQNIKIEQIRVSNVMSVQLLEIPPTNKFEIYCLNSKEQIIEKDSYTEWKFIAIPLLVGIYNLFLRISISEIIDKHGEKQKDIVVLNKEIEVIAEKCEQKVEFKPINDYIILFDKVKFKPIKPIHIFNNSKGDNVSYNILLRKIRFGHFNFGLPLVVLITFILERNFDNIIMNNKILIIVVLTAILVSVSIMIIFIRKPIFALMENKKANKITWVLYVILRYILLIILTYVIIKSSFTAELLEYFKVLPK